ncbi:MAG: flagellar export protein FliJ [Firmicutes bacterium]|nr:flagellar export protein FliJ [Bacillota bacterium]
MRRFKFKLQTNLDLVYKREELLKQEFFQQQKRFNQEMKALKQLRERCQQLQDEMRGVVQGTLNLARIKLYNDFFPMLLKQIKQQSIQVESARQDLESARHALMKIVKEKKILEKLRQRQWEIYQQEVLREEQKVIDELAVTGFYRHMNSST